MTTNEKQVQDKISKMCDQAETILYFFKTNSNSNSMTLPVGAIRGLVQIMENVVDGLCDLNEMGVAATGELIK
jgi:hypothetical protein